MKTIEVKKWQAKMPDGSETIETTLTVLSVLISSKKPEDMPKGLDNFRLFNRLSKAFEEADKTGKLELEDGDYQFLKKTIDGEMPAIWGMNKSICEAIELFLNA